MTRNETTFGISQNRVRKTEGLDRCANLINLPLRMGARIAGIGHEVAHRPIDDRQARQKVGRSSFLIQFRDPANDQRHGVAPLQLRSDEARGESGRRRAGQGRAGQVKTGQLSQI